MFSDGSLPAPPVRAFPSHPCVDRYFAAGSIEESRVRLMRTIERGDGPALLIGGAGMGKTMLLSVLATSLEDKFDVVTISSTQLCTRRALLQAILFGLKLPYQNREEGELRLTLVNRLQDQAACPHGAVLLIDEAQALPIRLLEELRILSNLARDGQPLVRLVLGGSPTLEEQFASTELESFNQRLAARCYLSAFNYHDTLQYVRAHAAAGGADPDELFEQAALESIFAASDGVPRLINQICDRAIVMAVERGAMTIDQGLVQAAWSDLHQLPAPWHTSEATLAEPEESVVEFGVLAGADDQQAIASLDDDASLKSFPAFTPVEPAVTVDALAEAFEPALGDWNADQALASVAADSSAGKNDSATLDEASAATAEAPVEKATPDASKLFGDEFDEEEVVIDRFASLEAAFTPATPAVVNKEDADFGALVEQHLLEETGEAETTPAEQAETDFAKQSIDADSDRFAFDSVAELAPLAEAAAINVFALNGDESGEDAATAVDVEPEVTPAIEPAERVDLDGDGEADVLIIETDATTVEATSADAHRQEYRQLFANLRRT